MCPPSSVVPLPDIGLYCSNEEIFKLLERLEWGIPPPSNVYTDINPYQYVPSNLPGEIWYLVRSEDKKDAELGFWKAREEPYIIFTDANLTGWRTTLEFFEGKVSNGRKTGWMMQEYKIHKKGILDKSKPKDSRSLCRVFLTDAASNGKAPTKYDNMALAKGLPLNLVWKENSNDHTNGQGCLDETQVLLEDCLLPGDYLELDDLDSDTSHHVKSHAQILPEDCISIGDYLELNDLDSETSPHILPEESTGDYLQRNDLFDPETPCSSSDNSSCGSRTSEDYFDLRDLDDDNIQQAKVFRLTVSTSSRTNETILCPAVTGSVIKDNGFKLPAEKSPSNSAGKKTLDEKVGGHALQKKDEKKGSVLNDKPSKPAAREKPVDKKVAENACLRMMDSRKRSASDTMVGSSSSQRPAEGAKKASAVRMKKLTKFLCFFSF